MTTRAERRQAPKHTGITPRKVFLAVAAVVFATIILLVAVALLGGPKRSSDTVSVVIPSGSGSVEIAKILNSEKIISSEGSFLVRAQLSGKSSSFKAGTYQFHPGSSDSEVIELLAKGPEIKTLKITIREGLTLIQTAEAVSDSLGIDKQVFIEVATKGAPALADKYPVVKGAYGDSLEGFLFPDTYEFREGVSAEQVIERMVARFTQVWDKLEKPSSRTKRYSTNELVTIASIAEREARILEERPLVVSVIDNRLDDNMRLQLCSSVQFLLPGEEERTKIRLTAEDIAIQSPYNTYINKGLPPGPIANPGANALEAAFHPAKTEYRYFVLTGKDGSQTFTKTYAEFQKAKSKSKAVLGE